MNARIMSGQGRRLDFTKVKVDKDATKRVIKRLWPYIKRYPLQLSIVTFSILISTAFNLILPLVLSMVIDNYLKVEAINLTAIGIIAGGIFISSVVISITAFFQQFLMAKMAAKVTNEIRKNAFDKLTRLPISYYDQNPHGEIMSKLTNDVETVFNALSQVVPQLISAFITITGAIVLMILKSWQLSIVTLLVIPVMIFSTLLITKKATKHFQTQQIKLGTINGIVKEDITGLKVVKLYNQEEAMISKFKEANIGLQKASFRGQLYSGMMMPLIRLIDNIIYGLLVTVGAILLINHLSVTVSIGTIQAMINYARMSTRPINNLAQIYNVLQLAIAGGDRIFKIIDEPDEYIGTSNETLNGVKGSVKFNHVSFGYEKDELVLKDINFEVKAGTTVAIVGPTGSGKTTIINLLTRFYDTTKGEILIDNVNIYKLAKDYLRSKVGIVLQTTYLFKGTVFENIRYGRPNATYEEVIAAAKLAQVHEIIERLPKKYETKVKEGGINFSHGERQLISIARTILSNPAILVLDEATSSVDTRTESKIQKSMGILVKNRTSFIIAHRLQTIKKADIIIVLKNGEIIEHGNHDELLANKGLYYEMYTTQFALNQKRK